MAHSISAKGAHPFKPVTVCRIDELFQRPLITTDEIEILGILIPQQENRFSVLGRDLGRTRYKTRVRQ
jgi:hypothetical protein